jgi:hypothetical protein
MPLGVDYIDFPCAKVGHAHYAAGDHDEKVVQSTSY